MHERHPSLRMDVLCGLFGRSKQAFYQHHRKADENRIDKERILLHIREIRDNLPGCGVRKIHEMLRRYHQTCHIGRDRLFDLLREEGMLIRKRKRKKRTTYSDHHMRVYPNAVTDVIPVRPNEIWVSDITYLQYLDKDYYLFLVTDAYSHKIVGWRLSDNMKVNNAVQALRMALRQRKDKNHLIHHSDRGSQYASYKYMRLLKRNGIMPSMTENGDPRENAIAERVNGILKEEFFKYMQLTENNINKEIANAITNYNTRRIHYSIGLMTPEEAHRSTGKLDRMWKKYPYRKGNMENCNKFASDKKTAVTVIP